MRQQLAFDMMLIWDKKYTIPTILLCQLAYTFLGTIVWYWFPVQLLIGLMAITLVSMGIWMTCLNIHKNQQHLSVSNYGSCMYFPTKRSYFFGSRAFHTLLMLCITCLNIGMTGAFASIVHRKSYDIASVVAHMFVCVITIFFVSGFFILTCMTKEGTSVGFVLVTLLTGSFTGGVVSIASKEDFGLSLLLNPQVVMVPCIVFVAWIASYFFAFLKSKKITV